jgi:hypothetical protein
MDSLGLKKGRKIGISVIKGSIIGHGLGNFGVWDNQTKMQPVPIRVPHRAPLPA